MAAPLALDGTVAWLASAATAAAAVRWGEAAMQAHAADCAIGAYVSAGLAAAHGLASAGVVLRIGASPIAGAVLGVVGLAAATDRLQAVLEGVAVASCGYFVGRRLLAWRRGTSGDVVEHTGGCHCQASLLPSLRPSSSLSFCPAS